VVCSTLEFEPVASRGPIIYPGRLLPRTVEALVPDGRVIVVVPLHRQERAARRRWAGLGERVAVAVHHPFDDNDLGDLAGRCRAAGATLVVMDSFAYTAEQCRDVAAATGLTVLSARRIVARIVGELLTPGWHRAALTRTPRPAQRSPEPPTDPPPEARTPAPPPPALSSPHPSFVRIRSQKPVSPSRSSRTDRSDRRIRSFDPGSIAASAPSITSRGRRRRCQSISTSTTASPGMIRGAVGVRVRR